MNWKGLSLYSGIHFALPALAGLLLFLFLSHRRLIPDKWAPSPRVLVAAYLLTRVVYAVFVYYVAGYDGYWDFNYYAERARKTLDGQTPGLEFDSHFNPLFYYLQAGGLWLIPDPKSVGMLLVYLVGDAISVVLASRLAERLVGQGWGSWAAAWLILCPLPWHALVVWGQDEGLFVGTLLGGVFAALRGKPVAAGLILGFGFCATKVTYAPYALAVTLAMAGGPRTWVRALAAMGGVCIAVFGGAMAIGGDPFGFMDYDTMDTLPWFYPSLLLRPLMPGWERKGMTLVYLFATVVSIVWMARHAARLETGWRLVCTVLACHCVSVILMPYSNPNYMLQALPLMLLFGALASTLLPRHPYLAVLAITCTLRSIRIGEWQEPERTLTILVFHACHAYTLVLVVLAVRQMRLGSAPTLGERVSPAAP